MYPRILERDTDIVDWSATITNLATTESADGTGSYNVRSSGILNSEYATLDFRGLTGAVTLRKFRCIGLHIAGPMEGNELTPYAVTLRARAQDETGRLFAFVGESPAVITGAAGGDVVTETQLLAVGHADGNAGSALDREFIVSVAERTADRGLCFGFAFEANSGAAANLYARCQMTVRKLISLEPRVIDTRKL